jgi:hypothetical protein
MGVQSFTARQPASAIVHAPRITKEIAREAFGAGVTSDQHFEDWWEQRQKDARSELDRVAVRS